MEKKGKTHEALANYHDDIGVPRHIHTDGGGELSGKKWDRVLASEGVCKQKLTETHSPWQNRAEKEIKKLKKHVQRIM